jgi:hypothetical protein
MAFFIFIKDQENVVGTFYKAAETQFELDNFNIIPSSYKIIQDSDINFNFFKLSQKIPTSYSKDIITYIDLNYQFEKQENLDKYINNFKLKIKDFLNNNPENPLFNKWNDYLTELNNIDTSTISYPLNMSFEQYLNNQGKLALNPLQVP